MIEINISLKDSEFSLLVERSSVKCVARILTLTGEFTYRRGSGLGRSVLLALMSASALLAEWKPVGGWLYRRLLEVYQLLPKQR